MGKILLRAFGVVVAFALVGCSHTGNGLRKLVGRPQYVAMGSSFAAGPGLLPRAEHSALLCGQSKANYAHLLAFRRRLELVDMTCSGAKTEHVLFGGQHSEGAQVRAITDETELVTVTIGGNDVFYMTNLIAAACDQHAPFWKKMIGACKPKPPADVEAGFATLPGRMAQIATEVHRRAPQARLIFVNYQTVLPESGTCDALSMSVEDVDRLRQVAARLAKVTEEAARHNNAEVFDAAALSREHNVCSASPWLAGAYPPRKLTAALHPNFEGMLGIAWGLDWMLGKRQ
jgi:hypothetical protein